MKLSDEVLNQGRTLVLNKDLDAFKEWQDENIPAWKHINPKPEFQKVYRLGMDGSKLFDALYSNLDPSEEKLKVILISVKMLLFALFLLLVILGSVGGIVYLFT